MFLCPKNYLDTLIVWRGIVQIRLDDDSLAIPSGQAYAQCLMRRHFRIAHVGVH